VEIAQKEAFKPCWTKKNMGKVWRIPTSTRRSRFAKCKGFDAISVKTFALLIAFFPETVAGQKL